MERKISSSPKFKKRRIFPPKKTDNEDLVGAWRPGTTKYLQHAVTCLVVASLSHADIVAAQNEGGEFRVLLVHHVGAIAREFHELLPYAELQHQVAVLHVEGVVKELEGAAKHTAGRKTGFF